jgi:hypothetical protein
VGDAGNLQSEECRPFPDLKPVKIGASHNSELCPPQIGDLKTVFHAAPEERFNSAAVAAASRTSRIYLSSENAGNLGGFMW